MTDRYLVHVKKGERLAVVTQHETERDRIDQHRKLLAAKKPETEEAVVGPEDLVLDLDVPPDGVPVVTRVNVD